MSLTERFERQPDGPVDEHPARQPGGTRQPKADGRRRRPARRWLRIGVIAAGATALVGGAIPAIAAATSSTVTYYACVTNSTGAIKIVGKTTGCKSGSHKISWNNTGPRGATGARGPAGVTKGYIDFSGGADLTNDALTTVGTLNLPAGNYMINAKVEGELGSSNHGDDVVSCDMDDSNGNTLDTNGVTLIPGLDSASGESMTLLGATSLAASGYVQIVCANGTGVGGGSAGSVVITAIPVSSIVTTSG